MNKTKNPLISVIVPVYMVSDYLDRCINSIVNQSYSNLEIVLVDDGSHDDCANKCDEWAQNDDRITIIHKLNGGQADARNYGIRIACGEWFGFVDSDDYSSVEFLEVLLSIALKHNSDIVVCDFVKIYDHGECEEYQDDLAVRDYSTSDALSALIDENPFYLHIWDKLYRRKVIQDIYFDVGRIHEDVFWLYRAFGSAERITRINHSLYFYLQRESSTTGQVYSLKSLDYLEEKWKSQLYIKKNYPELALQAKLNFFGSCMYMMQCVIKYMSGIEKCQAIAIIRDFKKKSRVKFKEIKTVHGSTKKFFYLAKINLYLCCKLRANFNIGF